MSDVTFRLTEDRERLRSLTSACEEFTQAVSFMEGDAPPPELAVSVARAALGVLEVEPGRARDGMSARAWIAIAGGMIQTLQKDAEAAAVLRALIGEEER